MFIIIVLLLFKEPMCWLLTRAFWHRGVPKCFTGMIFGQTHAPRSWTKVIKTVVRVFRANGIRCVIYLDDLLVFCGSEIGRAIRIRNWVFLFLLKRLSQKEHAASIKETALLGPCHQLQNHGFVLSQREVDSPKGRHL
jgi:hypothetical protein